MESKTSDLDARLQEITHPRAKLQKPRQGALPRSDQCDCLAGAVVLGGFQGWVQGLAQHSSFQARAALHLILPNCKWGPGNHGLSPLGTSPSS